MCHTQSQLVLASGLALHRFKEDENDLILFVDFGITEVLKDRLRNTFSRVMFLQSIYPAEYNTFKAKLKWYSKDWKKIKTITHEPYDRVFAVCDWLFLVQKTLKRVYRMNPSVDMAWIEDGITAYYSDSDIRGGLDSNEFTMKIRRLIIRDLFGIGRFYDRDFREMGGLKCLTKIYTCYPESVREPYRRKRKLIDITDDEYRVGLNAMYNAAKLDIKLPAVILVVDKLDRYEYPDKVKDSLLKFINDCRNDGKTIICKFHPRETQYWNVFDGCETMDKSVGIESTYLSLLPHKEEVTIVGIKSTGLMSSKKMGFKTVSLFKRCGENNDNLIKFYQKLDIKFI